MIRKVIHNSRLLAYQLLGLKNIPQILALSGGMSTYETDQRYGKVLDKLLLLEAKMNWRQHHQPRSYGQLRLETLATSVGSDSLDKILDFSARKFKALNEIKAIEETLDLGNAESTSLFVGSPNINAMKNLRNHSKTFFIADPADLLSESWCCESNDTKVVKASLTTFLQTQKEQGVNNIWLSDLLYKLDPLSQLLLIVEAQKALAADGVISGLITNNNSPIYVHKPELDLLKEFGTSLKIEICEDRFTIKTQ